ncbi:MAG: hypothetical protein HKN87_19475 [Saprospiraceae bacterium]|nr:hypothetical protein [Saprospiraceae bacterium]
MGAEGEKLFSIDIFHDEDQERLEELDAMYPEMLGSVLCSTTGTLKKYGLPLFTYGVQLFFN